MGFIYFHLNSYFIQASASPAPWKCSEEFFSRQIRNRDPLKIGFVLMSILHIPYRNPGVLFPFSERRIYETQKSLKLLAF